MTIKVRKISKILERKLKRISKELAKPSSMLDLGKGLRDDVVKRTRLGYGVSKNGGERQKLAPLSESYVLQRQGKLGFWTHPNGHIVPINTLTGKELKQFRASKSAKDQVTKNKQFLRKNLIKLDTTTSPKKSNLTRTGDMLALIGVVSGFGNFKIGFSTRKQGIKAAFVSKKRPFMNASRLEIKRVFDKVRKKLNSMLKDKINI